MFHWDDVRCSSPVKSVQVLLRRGIPVVPLLTAARRLDLKKGKKKKERKESLIRYERLESDCRGDIGEVPQHNLSKGFFFVCLFFI